MLLTWAAVPQGVRMPAAHELEPLEVRFPKFDLPLLQFLKARRRSLRRPPCTLVLASARSECHPWLVRPPSCANGRPRSACWNARSRQRGCRARAQACLHPEPEKRLSAAELLQLPYFAHAESWFPADFWGAHVRRPARPHRPAASFWAAACRAASGQQYVPHTACKSSAPCMPPRTSREGMHCLCAALLRPAQAAAADSAACRAGQGRERRGRARGRAQGAPAQAQERGPGAERDRDRHRQLRGRRPARAAVRTPPSARVPRPRPRPAPVPCARARARAAHHLCYPAWPEVRLAALHPSGACRRRAAR